MSNIAYSTETRNGFTNEKGEFEYLNNETITFSIGAIQLPSSRAKAVITPLDIVGTQLINNTTVLNIVRLLISLDQDDNPENGIQIDDQAHENAQGESVDFSSSDFANSVINIVANSGSSTTELKSAEAALRHITSTFNTRPVADAGHNQVLQAGVNSLDATLDGGDSYDQDEHPLEYHWELLSQPDCTLDSCPRAVLINPSSKTPTLSNMSETGYYVVSLVVNDGFHNSVNKAEVTLTLNKSFPQAASLFGSAVVFSALAIGLKRRRQKLIQLISLKEHNHV
ncbi:hypothetical protein [Sinobacterium caligoides]|uniref:hypothetical protein n=1 Tax=Sinobacterium caligoides TaxID=933926 RepID=UPI0011CE6F72|nr:hypothetical protein [Sinobacterium caligoides]